MNRSSYPIDSKIKCLALAVLLSCSVAWPSLAQVPPLPPLPSMPGIPGAPASPSLALPAVPAAPSAPASPSLDFPALAPLADLPAIAEEKKTEKVVETSPASIKPLTDEQLNMATTQAREAMASPMNPALSAASQEDFSAALPVMGADGSPVEEVALPPALVGADGLPMLPVLPVPGNDVAGTDALSPFSLKLQEIPIAGGESSAPVKATPVKAAMPVAILPEVNVQSAPKEKAWAVPLEPVSTAYKTKFNYRRQLLPGTIYRQAYNEQNKHLPIAVTRQDYANLLFASVTKNDVETTRALLNAGTSIAVTNSSGETLLAAARRSGATATAQLLAARGAKL